MKFLVAVLALLISVSAYGQHRDRHYDANGMPYGGHNPPVGVGGAHCMYSVYGCTGAGGSTGYYGYRPYPPMHHRPPPVYIPPPHYGCSGNYVNRYGNIGYYNGRIVGNIGFSRGQSSNCHPSHGHSHQSGSIGYYNGQMSGSFGFSQSQSY